jgi:hypothetical protein
LEGVKLQPQASVFDCDGSSEVNESKDQQQKGWLAFRLFGSIPSQSVYDGSNNG